MSLSPVTICSAGNLYAKKHGVPHIIHCLDLWPESVIVTKAVREKSPTYKILYHWSRSIYKNASKILVSSPSFVEYFDKVLKLPTEDISFVPQSSLIEDNGIIPYEYGKGTSVDLTKAVHYFEEAAKLGNTTAQKNLAICYKNGTGVNVNPEKAFFWTLEAAKLSDQDAQRNIAFYYLKGYGTNKNDEESLIWYARCYHRNNSISNAEQAFWAFAEKAQEGDAQSLYVAGKCLQYGIAIDKNIVEANSYFEKAADLGHVESMIKLRLKTSLCELCSSKEAKDNFKDSYGVAYSKDKKVLISTGYIKAEEYKIADGTRIICDNAFYYASIQKVIIPSSVLVIGNNPFSEYKNGWGEKYYINNVESISYNFVVSDNALYTRDMKRLISYFGKDSKFVIPQGVEIIGKRAFADKYNLILRLCFNQQFYCII
jgi:TPR repeat protein